MFLSDRPSGQEMHTLMRELFPICRSITGDGVRETLKLISAEVGEMDIIEVPSGTEVFDWVVPKEWNINDAYIVTPSGKKICKMSDSNLNVVNYSIPVSKKISLNELKGHLYTIPDQPLLTPYITSYYAERWGFCLPYDQYVELEEGEYEVFIDSTLKDGSLTYAELVLPGESDKEVFFSTYVCHPSMANNELSGPLITSSLIKYLQAKKSRRYTYRFVFIPETIGSITYLARNKDLLKANVFAGFNVSCVGDEGLFSYMPTRHENTISDKVVKHVLGQIEEGFREYSYLERGSDERQYCSPGVDLPVVSLMRSKYGEFPEYHTSADNLDFVTEKGLSGTLDKYIDCVEILESNRLYRAVYCCEPQMGKRGLYPTIGNNVKSDEVVDMMNILAYCDGSLDVIDIAEKLNVSAIHLLERFSLLEKHGLISEA